jgi:hypothetical protein
MALADVGNGTNTCDGTLQTITTETAAKTYVLVVDLNDMANGETLDIQILTKPLTGGTSRIAYTASYANVQTGAPIAISVPVPSLFEYIVKFLGTNTLSIPWVVMTVD